MCSANRIEYLPTVVIVALTKNEESASITGSYDSDPSQKRSMSVNFLLSTMTDMHAEEYTSLIKTESLHNGPVQT
jgi:hypothetical protein